MEENQTDATDADSAVEILHVRIEGSESFFDRAEEAVQSHDTNDADGASTERGLSLPDEEALARVFTAQNLQLIRAIAEHEPASMRDLADLVGRDIKNVSGNLNELESLGLVDLVAEGRAKRPVIPYDEIEVHYPVRDSEDDSAPSEASPADD